MPIGIHRVFESLFAEFVRGEMVAFAVRGCSGSVGMFCQVV